MRPASAALMSALHALHTRPANDSRAAWVQAINDITAESHPIVVLGLAPLVLRSDPEAANTAVRVIYQLFQRIDESGILWIAREARHFGVSNNSWFNSWAELRQPDVPNLDTFGEASLGLMCLCSVHANGYVRQESVERLGKYSGPLSMAFLLLRMNDWVRPVRGVARITVLGRLYEARQGDRGRFDELLQNLGLAQNIERWGREDNGVIREAIESTLASQPVNEMLAQANKTKVGARQLRLFRRALQHHPEARQEILERGLTARNGAVRFWAAREAIRCLSSEELSQFIGAMQQDSLAIIRYEAVFALATKLHPNDQSILIPFLVDPSPDVRFLAAYYLEKLKFDVRNHYLEILNQVSGPALAAVIAAIGTRGKPGDEQLIKQFCEHSDVAVRSAAVFARGKLQRDTDVSWILVALRDSHKLVVREAARQLEARVHIITPRVFDDWLASETRISMRRQALRIGAKMERWEALGFLLRIAAQEDPALHYDVEREMRRWLQQFVDWYATPNSEQLQMLERALIATRQILPESWRETLTHILARQKKR